MRMILFVAILAATFSSCGSGGATKAIPGAGGDHLYELMDEDSTELKADSIDKGQ